MCQRGLLLCLEGRNTLDSYVKLPNSPRSGKSYRFWRQSPVAIFLSWGSRKTEGRRALYMHPLTSDYRDSNHVKNAGVHMQVRVTEKSK